MDRTIGSALSFQLTGWAWIVLSSLLGLGSFLGMLRGSPLPPALRLIHAHGTLVGGILQILIGLALASIELTQPPSKRAARLLRFIGFNAAALGLTVGSIQRDSVIMMASGIVLAMAIVPLFRPVWSLLQTWTGWTTVHSFMGVLAAIGLVACLGLGMLLAGLWYPEWHGVLRLSHLHSGVLMGLVLIGLTVIQLGIPSLIQRPLSSAGLAHTALLCIPACVAGLLTGFLLTSVPIQLAAGGGLLLFLGLYTFTLLRTWSGGSAGSAATDHLLIAVFFLVVTTVVGLGIGYNVLSTPPIMPYGTLHLIAYTHLTFIGFLLHATIGGLAFCLPTLLSAHRVPSHKKRPAYQAELEQIMNRWRTLQIAALSFGTLGLGLVASLTWNLPLGSAAVQTASWISFGLLLTGMTLVTIKLAQVVGTAPSADKHHHEH
ncbi:MAG: hypothetical protein KF814_05965 [Nitrospiraceae bacterium]|nr:hypothetical protein [Nitrospiraceae bacterium]